MENFKFLLFIVIIKSILNKILINNKNFNIFPNLSNTKKYSYESNDNLYFIFSIFRHGVRAPMDKEFENNTDLLGGKWNQKAELTLTGRKQHYNIGLKNKKRYSNFINITYDPKEIIVYSTNTNRTISSAQSQLLGLFNGITYINESNFDIINNKNKVTDLYRIIPPIYLFNENKNFRHNLLFKRPINKFETILQYRKFCRPMIQLINKNYENFENSPEIDSFIYKFNQKYGDILKRKYKINNLMSRKDFKGFCDAFISNYFDENNKNVLEYFLNEGFNITNLLYECYFYHGHYLFEIDGNGYAKNNCIINIYEHGNEANN